MHHPQLTVIGAEKEQIKRIKEAVAPQYEVRVLPQEAIDTPAINSARVQLFLLLSSKSRVVAPLIEKLRTRCPETPVLLLGRHPSRKEIIEAFRQGASDFLIPPLTAAEFRKAIRTHTPSFRYRWQTRLQRILQKIRLRLFPANHRSATLALAKEDSLIRLGIVPEPFIPNGKEVDLLHHHDLRIRFFGSFDIHFKGTELKKVPGRKVSSLLAYLLHHHGRPIHREVLMDTFWGDNTPASARNSLNVAIHHIRRHFARAFPEQDIILYKNENYIINPELDIVTDVELFTNQWRKGRIVEHSQGLEAAVPAYNKAISLYRGDFLEELRYDEWCAGERDNFQEIYLFLLDRLSSFFLGEGEYTAAINLCKKALSKDPCLEDIHRRLIASYHRLNYRDLAIRQYYRCEEMLERELGVKPTRETGELFREISHG